MPFHKNSINRGKTISTRAPRGGKLYQPGPLFMCNTTVTINGDFQKGIKYLFSIFVHDRHWPEMSLKTPSPQCPTQVKYVKWYGIHSPHIILFCYLKLIFTSSWRTTFCDSKDHQVAINIKAFVKIAKDWERLLQRLHTWELPLRCQLEEPECNLIHPLVTQQGSRQAQIVCK